MISHLARRTAETWDSVSHDLPDWTGLLALVNLIVFVPVIVYLTYTVQNVYLTLAMIEDDHVAPPAYEAVPTTDMKKEEHDDDAPLPAYSKDIETISNPAAPGPITASFCTTTRALRDNAGIRGLFRGLGCYAVIMSLTMLINCAFSHALSCFTFVVAALALTSLNTAWVHIIMTPASTLSFWHRLPAFRRTIAATFRPIMLVLAAQLVTVLIPVVVFGGLSYYYWDILVTADGPEDVDIGTRAVVTVAFFTVAAALLTAAARICLVIPAQVILARIRASLLPADALTIVSFDRSFGGAVDVSNQDSYATITDVWRSFSRASWRRVVGAHIQVVLISFGVTTGILFVVFPQVLMVMMYMSM